MVTIPFGSQACEATHQCSECWMADILKDSWTKRDQLYVTCFIISLFTAQHVSDVNTSILRNLRLIWWVKTWVVLFWFVVCWCYTVVVWYPYAGWSLQHTSNQSNTTHALTHQISRKLLRMDVLTSVTCWAVNNEIIKQVTSSWSLSLFNFQDEARSNKHRILKDLPTPPTNFKRTDEKTRKPLLIHEKVQ